MALPGGATGFSLTGGPYDDPAFQGMAGVLTMSTPVTHVATGERIRKTWNFSIDYSGNFSVGPLPFTDDPAFTPTGFTYTITWQALSYRDTPGNLTFQVPTAAGTTIDFDTLFPAVNGQTVPLGVYSVNGHQGAVTLGKADVGLGSVDNTADTAKPVSTAQATALAAKATIADIPTAGTATGDALRAAFVAVETPEAHGALGDGATDDTAAVNAAIAAVQAAGGGVVLLNGTKTYRCLGAITPVYTGPSNAPVQKPVRITSNGGAAWSGYWSSTPVNGGGILDLRYDGTDGLHPAKIDTRGAGFLEIDHLTLMSGGTDDFPFFQTTNTTCHIHHNAFVGNSAKSGTTCAQDAIIFGGTTTTIGNTATAPFQGYGSSVHDNFFSAIRRCFYGRKYCNATWVYKNTVSTKCGSSLTGGAAFVLEGSGTDYCTGNVIAENLVEFSSYKYAVRLAYANSNSVVHNNFFDNGAGTLGGVLCDVVTDGNMVIEGFCPIVPDFTEDATVTGHNTHITSHSGISSTFAQPTAFTNVGAGTVISRLMVAGGASNFTVQPAAATGSESSNLFQIKRAAAEGTNPSLVLLSLLQNGGLTVSGPSGGTLALKDNTATTLLQFNATGRLISAPSAGGTITIDTGSGGSAFIAKAFGIRNTKYDSSATTTWYTGNGTPEGAVTATVGCLYTRADGGAGTTLYVKESGTGNTGWIAK